MFGVFSCVLIGFCLFTLCPLLLVLSLGAPEKHLAYFLYTLSPGIYTHRGSPTEPFLLQDEQSQLSLSIIFDSSLDLILPRDEGKADWPADSWILFLRRKIRGSFAIPILRKISWSLWPFKNNGVWPHSDIGSSLGAWSTFHQAPQTRIWPVCLYSS